MHIETLPLGELQTNCYLVSNDAGEAYIIDPGGDATWLLQRITSLGLKLRAVLLTHAHIDHIGAVPDVVDALAIPVLLHDADEPLFRSPLNALPPWLPPVRQPLPEICDKLDRMPDGLHFKILKTPGHTQGGISFHFPAESVVFSGDALFQRSIGRTDLPGGNSAQLLRSIRQVLFALPDETTVYPGHGAPTTIGEERRGNPFL